MYGLISGISLTVLAIAFLASTHTRPSDIARVPGHNNTVLFIAGGANGLTNVHLAASYGLLEHTPHVQVHYASFPQRKEDISRISSVATQKYPASESIRWHGLPGPDYIDAVYRHIGNISGMIFAPGLKGINRLVEGMSFHLDPWERDDYVRLYYHLHQLIQDIDPSVIVLDPSLRPALDATLDSNRQLVMLSPNALVDVIAMAQPWGKTLWKYPAQGSGIPYPIPWKQVPLNVYLHLRFATAYLFDRDAKATRAYYETKGIRSHQHFLTIKNVPWITMTIPGGGLPLSVPKDVTECGPIVLDTTKVKDASPELHSWLNKAPIVLVNLGSMFKYDETRARIMADTIGLVLEKSDVNVFWKFKKLGTYSDDFLKPLERLIDTGRLRYTSWLDVEPFSLLQSGQIALAVHHGGANSFHEAIYAGVPQVVLPLWYDCYNYAQLAEYLKVGIWPAQQDAPSWDEKALSNAILQALNGQILGINSRRIAKAAQSYAGRKAAAELISRMAKHDKS